MKSKQYKVAARTALSGNWVTAVLVTIVASALGGTTTGLMPLFKLDYNSYKFNINYTNCEITCVIDKETSRMTSLKHKMIMDIEIVMNLDLILFQTKNVKAQGRIVNFLEYYNFDWT